ncbi:hypothetical protein MMC09_001748 [Bachmanniomyces sp. S44760]|nr:hypothetical protein [Bachmanniomyces sp. S44760]
MNKAAVRPKRGGEEFARTHYLDNDGPSAKKPRFDIRNPSALAPDAPEEDAILEADEIGKRGQQTKRNAVNIDGYESDSSNEGFDARADSKATEAEKGNRPAKSKTEEDADMFADLEDGHEDGDANEELSREGKKKTKDVRFVEVDEIEGQVAGSKSGGHVSADFSLRGSNGKGKERDHDIESSSESDVDEAERADIAGQVDEEVGAGGKKEHAPKLEAFNLRAEKEDGRFDENMNYVRKAADPDAIHDSWLEGVSKKDMKKAKEAADKRDEERRQRNLEADALLTSDILKTLIPHLDRGESVLEALARLGRGNKKKPKWQDKAKRKQQDADQMEVDVTKAPDDPQETQRRQAVEAITGAADQLLTRGQTEIYEQEREMLMRQYQRETGEAWAEPPKEDNKDTVHGIRAVKEWEYRWSDARDGGEAHGPYDGAMMLSWNDAGYFGEGVEFREIGQGGNWRTLVHFV